MTRIDLLCVRFFSFKKAVALFLTLFAGSILVLSTGCDGPYHGQAPIVHGGVVGNSAPKKDLLLSRIKVKRGDSLYSIAKRYQVGLRQLIDKNGVKFPYRIYPGQTLKLPKRFPNKVHNSQIQTSIRLKEKKLWKAKANYGDVNDFKYNQSASQAKGSQKPKAKGRINLSVFIWPIKGTIVSRFGNTGKGLHNDGINILARQGTPVRAVQGGIVAYAGNELRGFGNLLLVKHAGGWISAYAHNERLLVNTGEKVEIGQVISKVGSTGSVNKPQLHFELRRGTKAVNPESFLVKKTTARTIIYTPNRDRGFGGLQGLEYIAMRHGLNELPSYWPIQ